MSSLSGSTERAPRRTRDGFTLEPDRKDLAVRVQDLRITYKTTFEKRPTLKQAVVRFGRGTRQVHTVEALKGISFDVKLGTTVGVIGANGAGKSTLLRALAGILPPTSGHIETWGKASTMLALGVGFNNALTGRENIILGGLAAGLSKKAVRERAEQVAEWAEAGTDPFIDRPMRTYSSGQNARVGFSVGVHMDPDILMVDEALSTGDAGFRERAAAKLEELRAKSRAMFFVSHGLASVRELCDDCIWLDHGNLMMRGHPDQVTEAYLKFLHVKNSEQNSEEV
ncbi:ABC-2 type transport system ATP-binding protein/teichoic acid transport system ATP-binding protein [Propionibacteriaceae bacterium ES.041]|uniref:ABC transporter ATP-binding protein n=1 Tax=Enemella evansiae TaxID=2016499 RepID=UPI000C01932F|nr:ABC transporter ATP-binding protein [Enemella evansiae]PFG69362.1 ABC-2 type transport system ATP-binding protein/teichoic acid transport system ATP-binding protein [Propionibacteriaceae bacterium ES.041]TDO91869.1 ABC-2 type transport system ATP-binding protein/teichoic acid transport system ATP-binding protein [Enemella evansiae]